MGNAIPAGVTSTGQLRLRSLLQTKIYYLTCSCLWIDTLPLFLHFNPQLPFSLPQSTILCIHLCTPPLPSSQPPLQLHPVPPHPSLLSTFLHLLFFFVDLLCFVQDHLVSHLTQVHYQCSLHTPLHHATQDTWGTDEETTFSQNPTKSEGHCTYRL